MRISSFADCSTTSSKHIRTTSCRSRLSCDAADHSHHFPPSVRGFRSVTEESDVTSLFIVITPSQATLHMIRHASTHFMTIETTSTFCVHNSFCPRVLIHASSHFTTVHQITHAQHSEYDVIKSKPLVTCESTIRFARRAACYVKWC